MTFRQQDERNVPEHAHLGQPIGSQQVLRLEPHEFHLLEVSRMRLLLAPAAVDSKHVCRVAALVRIRHERAK
jgi:hypothetical protein